MNCSAYRKMLVSNESGSLRGVNEHLEACVDCSAFLERYRRAIEALETPAAGGRDAAPHPGFAAGVMAALPAAPDPLGWAALRLLPATGALALALLGWCWLATPTPGELWTQAGDQDPLTWVLAESETGAAGEVTTGGEPF